MDLLFMKETYNRNIQGECLRLYPAHHSLCDNNWRGVLKTLLLINPMEVNIAEVTDHTKLQKL